MTGSVTGCAEPDAATRTRPAGIAAVPATKTGEPGRAAGTAEPNAATPAPRTAGAPAAAAGTVAGPAAEGAEPDNAARAPRATGTTTSTAMQHTQPDNATQAPHATNSPPTTTSPTVHRTQPRNATQAPHATGTTTSPTAGTEARPGNASRPGFGAGRPGHVDVWLVPVRPRPEWLGLLDDAERARHTRLAATPAGDVFTTSRALQRLWAAATLGIPPAEVVIDRSCEHCGDPGHGRPRLPGAPAFSVSHTGHWLLLAAAATGLIGADVEDPAAAADPAGLAGVVLSAPEYREFSAAAPAERKGRLLTAWTRKEAAMKLAGLGLAAAPARVDVQGPLARSDVPGWPREAVHLRALAVPGGHVAALATTVPIRAVHRRDLAEFRVPAAGVNGPLPLPGAGGRQSG